MPFGRKAAAPACLRLFNIDLHHAVIADVKDVLKRLYGNGISITDWSLNLLDGRSMGFPPATKQAPEVSSHDQALNGPMLLNHVTWYSINDELIEQFLARHRLELAGYDGFIVTHTPVFCRLFESFNKPIILVNSCRYDHPYTFSGDLQQRSELNACLQRLQKKKLLLAISNNKGDQAYLKLGAQIESTHIPSLCAYTKVSYDLQTAKDKAPIMICQKYLTTTSEQDTLLKQAGILRAHVDNRAPPKQQQVTPSPPEIPQQALPPPQAAQQAARPLSWAALYCSRALIHVPYEISTMSLFEQYSAGVPLLLPTKRFLMELMQAYDSESDSIKKGGSADPNTAKAKLNSRYWTQFHSYVVKEDFAAKFGRLNEMVANQEAMVTALSADPGQVQIEFGKRDRTIPSEVNETFELDWWLEKADFYDGEWMPFLRHFDSWEELVEMVQSAPDPEKHRQKAAWLEERRAKILSMWRQGMKQTFPQSEAFAAEQEKKMEEERKEQEKKQVQEQRKTINEKQVLWEETLDKLPTPQGGKTVWGAQGGSGNEEAQRLSLVIIEPREHPWMRAALHNACNIYGGSGAGLYIFHSQQNKAFIEDIVAGWSGVNLVVLPKDDFSVTDYCRMLCTSWFYEHFPTSHCLVFQTDVLMRRRIPTNFFSFHFVGAPWHHLPVCSFTDSDRPVVWHGHNGKKVVGNGGFSLRDVAAMKKICSSFSYGELADHCNVLFQEGRFVSGGKLRLEDRTRIVNEDVWLSSHVAPDKLPSNHEAAEFSVEHIWHPNPCGLHKAYVSWEVGPRMYTTDMLAALLETVVDPTRAPEQHKFGDRKTCIDWLHPDESFVQEAPADVGAFEVVWGPLSKLRSGGRDVEDYFLHPCDRHLPEGACRPAQAFEECKEQPATL